MEPSSQTIPRAAPASVGLSHERLERVGAALRTEIAAGTLPGAVIAIARQGKLAYFEAFGYLDPAAGMPMPHDASSASHR